MPTITQKRLLKVKRILETDKPAAKPKTWHKVETYSNWCEIDRLDGVDLKDEERVRVKWPSGAITRHYIILEESSRTESDMGHPCEIQIKEAFIKVEFQGHKFNVPLKNTTLLLQRGWKD